MNRNRVSAMESNVSTNEVSAIDITRKVELPRAIQSILSGNKVHFMHNK